MIGVDICNKVKIKVDTKVEYANIYSYSYEIISQLEPQDLMTQNLYFLTELSPSNNHYLQRGRWGHSYTPASTKKFQNKLKNMSKKVEGEWVIPHENKYIDTEFTFWFKEDRPDANNYFKVNLDVLEDDVYINDKRTIPIVNNIFIGEDIQLFEVSMSNKIGVFDDLEQLQSFVQNNCLKCKIGGYNRKCSNFFNLLESRVSNDYTQFKNECKRKK